MKHKSQAVSKRAEVADEKPDARVARTRAGIDHAFVELLFQRAYRTLKVSDITRKAGVGRATFYAHYQSKDSLLESQMQRIILPILRPRPGTPYLLDCTLLFAHVLSAPRLFRNISSGGEGSGARVVRTVLEDHIGTLFDSPDAPQTGLPPALIRRFLVSTLITVMTHGLLADGAESPQQMQHQFEVLAGSGRGAAAS